MKLFAVNDISLNCGKTLKLHLVKRLIDCRLRLIPFSGYKNKKVCFLQMVD